MRWSQIAKQDAAWRFISLTDGKQPMFVWWAMVIMKYVKDPLLAGRFVSVIAGMLSAIGLFFLTRELFQNKWVGFIAVAIYIIFPFSLVYDRMALYDSLVAASIIWGIYIEVLLAKRVRLDLAFIAALIVGAGMLVKTNAFFNLYFLPATLLVFDWKQKNVKKQLGKWILFACITAVLSNVYYGVLRLSPYFGIIAEKDHTFIYPLSEWLHHPFTFFLGNLHGLLDWFITYYGWVAVFLTALVLIVWQKLWKEKLLLLVWAIPPFIGFALFAKVMYPRYILPMVVPLIPLLALSVWYIISSWKNIFLKVVVILLFAVLYLRVDYYILFDFSHAPIAEPDLAQYLNAWPAGGGVTEMVAFFSKESQNKKIFVASEGTFGSVPTLGVEIYLDHDTNVEKQGIYPIPSTIPSWLVQKAKVMPTYMVFNYLQKPPQSWPLTLVARYQKGIGNWYLSVYKVEVK